MATATYYNTGAKDAPVYTTAPATGVINPPSSYSMGSASGSPYPSSGGTYQPNADTFLGTPLTPYTPEGVYVQPTPMSFPTTSMPSYALGNSVTLQSGMPGVSNFTFNMAAEQQAAYEKLKPFYDRLLSFAGGNLDRAKRIIEYTYQSGMRESEAEYQQKTKEEALKRPEEWSQMNTAQNKRGILESGFGKEARGRLTQAQILRQEAIDRAKQKTQTDLTANRGFGLEEKQAGFNEDVFNMERNRQKEASGMALDKYGMKSSEWNSQVTAAQAAENRRIAQEANAGSKAQADYYNKLTSQLPKEA